MFTRVCCISYDFESCYGLWTITEQDDVGTGHSKRNSIWYMYNVHAKVGKKVPDRKLFFAQSTP